MPRSGNLTWSPLTTHHRMRSRRMRTDLKTTESLSLTRMMSLTVLTNHRNCSLFSNVYLFSSHHYWKSTNVASLLFHSAVWYLFLSCFFYFLMVKETLLTLLCNSWSLVDTSIENLNAHAPISAKSLSKHNFSAQALIRPNMVYVCAAGWILQIKASGIS